MAGEYLEFTNNSTPALSGPNVNLMQQRIRTHINSIHGTELYKNTSGGNVSQGITLSETIDNFDFIEIYCGKSASQGLNIVKIDLSVSTKANVLSYIQLSSSEVQFIVSRLSVSGTSLTQDNCQVMNISSSNIGIGTSTEMRVYKVIGYKIIE